jgi:peptide/nickel transport system substrate-binding protein
MPITSPSMRRRELPVLAALAAGLMGMPVRPACAATRDELTVARATDVRTLDPSADTSEIGLVTFKNIFDQLTDIGPDGVVGPRLATSWTASPDATVWTFKIRTGAKFHDGSAVTVDDVLWTFRKILNDERAPPRSYLAQVASVEKAGEDGVVFNLNTPFAPLDRQVSLISILPRAAYEAVGDAKFSTAPVGSGPYKVTRWVKDDRLELESFPEYWRGAPSIRKVTVRPIPSEASRVAVLQSGEIDIVPQLPPASIARLQASRDLRVETVPTIRIIYIGFNTNHPVLSKLPVRQAIDMAIDRVTITQRLLRGLGKPEGQLVAPMTFGYDPEIKPTAFDAARAKVLLKEANYQGEVIPLQYPNNRWAFAAETAQAIAGFLKAVGMNVELQGMEYTAMFPLWFAKNLPGIHMFGFGPTIMDATLVLNSLFLTRGYWMDPEVMKLVDEQRSVSDLGKRRELISRIWRRAQEQVPYSVLYNEYQAYGINKALKWTPRADEAVLFNQASFTPA